ncbi:MAG TPA: protein-disulfide reductase DsbD domain-containing protein [Verrucomicrobiales bacterium]|jgi:thiol:disulfide interchange protein DsbD|nr:protein-disulfide reductase DsbD domain-containing protein [Verrucomicrobiales bacterium]
MKLIPFLAMFILSAVLRAADQPPPWQGVGLTVQPVSEVTAIRPGQPFYAGLFLHHQGGTHTYWQSPGLAGVATHLEWTLPKGWTAGEIEWPAPDKVKMASINTHGFERDVLLMVKITPPAKVDEKTVTLKTKAVWMCCGTTCEFGNHDFQITLPVEAGTEPAWNAEWRKVFERERATFPVPLTGWKLSAARSGKKITLTADAEQKNAVMPEDAIFFSTDNLICSHPPQKWTKTATGFQAELEVSEFPPKDQTKLRGVITGTKAWQAHGKKAAVIEVPLKVEAAGK